MVERKIERNKLVRHIADAQLMKSETSKQRANANLEPTDKVSLFQCVALLLDCYYYCYY